MGATVELDGAVNLALACCPALTSTVRESVLPSALRTTTL